MIFGALRLARFNSQLVSYDKDYFKGLPIPASALTICAFVMTYQKGVPGLTGMEAALLMPLIVVLSLLMVSTIKYRSFKDLKFKGHRQITYLVWGILALMMVAAWPAVMLFVVFAGYALMGPVEKIVGLLVPASGKRGIGKVELPQAESNP